MSGAAEPPETERHAEYRTRLEAARRATERRGLVDRRLSGLRLLTFAYARCILCGLSFPLGKHFTPERGVCPCCQQAIRECIFDGYIGQDLS